MPSVEWVCGLLYYVMRTYIKVFVSSCEAHFPIDILDKVSEKWMEQHVMDSIHYPKLADCVFDRFRRSFHEDNAPAKKLHESD